MQTDKKETIVVLGAGNFGTCLAQHLATVGHNVKIWARDPQISESINKEKRNSKYLKETALSKNIAATSKLSTELIDNANVILFTVPTQGLREVLTKIKGSALKEKLLISAAKGIEIHTLKLPDQIVIDVLGEKVGKNLVALSGPSFAVEVAKKLPTAVSLASSNIKYAEWAQQVFHSPHFRAYTSNDPIGLEVAGALKNVIAIAAGACDGLGYQANSRAALITRGLAEITRVGVAMGADPLTFIGLGGVGDLFLTCTSNKSRNFTVGYRLGQGESLSHIIDTLGSIAEGIHTTKSAHHLSEKLSIDMPITSEVYKVIYEDKPIKEAVQDLLHREAKMERY